MTVSNQTVLEVDRTLTQVIRNVDPNLLKKCKTHFEKNLPNLCRNKLELTLIIDANIVISDALSYTKNKKSFLLELSNSPFLRLFAPPWLKEELERKVIDVSKKQKIDESKFRTAVSMFLEKITIVNVEDTVAYKKAFELVGQRDEKDVQYLKLYFSMESHGVLTRDKDISEIPEIKVWERPAIAGKVVSVFEKGAFSFLIIGEGLPQVFRFFYETCALILRGVWEVAETIGTAVYTLVEKGIEAISRFPDWVKMAVGIGAILLILWDKSRERIISTLQIFYSQIFSMLNWFYTAIKSILNFITPLIDLGLTVIAFLFTKIEDTLNTHNQINSQSIGGM